MNSKCSIPVREDGLEIVEYLCRDFFVHICLCDVSEFDGTSADTHWHDDIELIAVLSGHMMFNINGSIERINAGEGLVINSRQMHYNYSDNGAACQYIVVLLHPVLLCVSEQTELNLVKPLIEDLALPYIVLDSGIQWKREVLNSIQEMYDFHELPVASLRIQSLFCKIWANIFEHAEHCRRGLQTGQAKEKTLTILKSILAYIHTHYRERITLDDLAQAGFISKSYCMTLFHKYIHDSPIKYLIKYRMKMSEELLINSNINITSVAYQVGFSSASFYIETFRKYYGYTPLEYRRNHWRKNSQAEMDEMQIKMDRGTI